MDGHRRAARPGPSAPWRAVGFSMAVGAIYDAAFAVAILFAAEPASRLLGLALPADRAYFGLNGVFLLLLAGLYTLPAFRPERYRGVVAVAAGGRAVGAVYLTAVWADGRETAFLLLGLADGAFAVAHAALLARAVARSRGDSRGIA